MKPTRENEEACSFQRTEWVITVAALKWRNAFLFRILFLVKAGYQQPLDGLYKIKHYPSIGKIILEIFENLHHHLSVSCCDFSYVFRIPEIDQKPILQMKEWR